MAALASSYHNATGRIDDAIRLMEEVLEIRHRMSSLTRRHRMIQPALPTSADRGGTRGSDLEAAASRATLSLALTGAAWATNLLAWTGIAVVGTLLHLIGFIIGGGLSLQGLWRLGTRR